jgi:uncharacterized membrane protein
LDQQSKNRLATMFTWISIAFLLIAITLLVVNFSSADEKRKSSTTHIVLIPVGITFGIIATTLRAKSKS